MKIDGYYIAKKGLLGHSTMPTVVVHSGSDHWPVMYLRQPNCISKDDFDMLVDSLTLKIPQEIEFYPEDGNQ